MIKYELITYFETTKPYPKEYVYTETAPIYSFRE